MKVLVTGASLSPEQLQPLVEAGFRIENPPGVLSQSELKAALADASAYLLGGEEYASREALSEAHGLKHIAFLGMGYETYVSVEAARERGVVITNTPDTLTNSVAEFTVIHLLNAARRFLPYAVVYAAGAAGAEQKQRDLAALHVGIVGLGAIGTRVAEILVQGFGARVSYFSRTRKPEAETRLGLAWLPLEDLAAHADALVVITPGNPSTHHLIDAGLLARARPGLILVNTGREDVVDPSALLATLDSGQVGYAGFDVFYPETSPWTAALKRHIPEHLTVTGHIAALTHQATDAMAARAIASILNVARTGTDGDAV